MPDFSKLYQRPAGEAKRPPTMPGGDYPSIVRSYEMIESQQKHTPGARYHLTLLDWPSTVPEEWVEVDEEGKRWEYRKEEVDLAKRQQRFDFYFPTDEGTGETSEGSLYRFDQFLRACGIDPEGQTYETLIPSVVGHRVLCVMKQSLNTQTNRLFTQVDRLIGQR